MARTMQGRRILTSDEIEITRDNILRVLNDVESSHLANSSEIKYLWEYYKGKQPVLGRKKVVRPEICNRIVENRALEIVDFKTGYLVGEPIQYVSRGSDDDVADDIAKLNTFMLLENKASLDRELVEWQHIAGTAYRMVLPGENDNDVPFSIYTLDPRSTFVVYSNGIGNRPLIGVTYIVDKLQEKTYSVYTSREYFEIRAGVVIKHEQHTLGMIPIFEYPANNARLGAFEPVLPLLDAINTTASNRLDGVEQFIQSFVKFINCDISADDFTALKDLGAIKVKSVDGQQADVDIVANELNQGQAQTLTDDMYQTVLTITGMPNRNGGSSTSDTSQAVVMRDGWNAAETRAKISEMMIRQSEMQFLKLLLRILQDVSDLNLKAGDIGISFTRRILEAVQSKSQVLVSLLQQEKVHPLLAFTASGLFTDPEGSWLLSKNYYEEQQAKLIAQPPDTVEEIEVVQQ